MDLSCLLWADDLVIFSKTAEGLQNAITKTKSFYESLGLKINTKKTKILIFNKKGVKLDKSYGFFLGENKLEISDHYQYLGLKLRPSGSMTFAVQKLNTKATRAWFSISKVIFKHKRMEVDKALQIFDSLVTPVSTYGCEFWLPYSLPAKSFKSHDNLLSSWESLPCEKLNQQLCRMLLSVHRKTSRLAVLGELGRCPALLGVLSHCLNYKLALNLHVNQDSILGNLMNEMKLMADTDQDCWLTRVQKMEKLLCLPKISGLSKTSGKLIKNGLRKQFETFWLDKVNSTKIGPDMTNHNKLRTYSKIKLNFTREPYVSLVKNRNQRVWLSRLRTSSHNLGVERGRYSGTPLYKRTCTYCVQSQPSLGTMSSPAAPPPSIPSTPASQQTSSTPTCINDEFHF